MMWERVAISEVSNVVTGSTPKTNREDFFGGDIPFVTPAELEQANPIVSTPRTLSTTGAQQVRIVPPNAILVCCIGSLGKVGIAGRTLATNQQINAVVFDERKVWPRFGYYACRLLKQTLENMAPATTVAIVSKSKFQALEIPLPPLDEQKRIAAILDQADELRRKRQRAIDRLNQLGQAIFHDMFGGINGADAAWTVKPLEDLCDLVRGSSPRPQGDPRYFGGPVPRLMIADITRDGMNVTPRIDSLTEEGARKSRPMPSGSVVMAVSGAVGLPAILTVDACIHDGFVGFRNLNQSVLPQFFYWFLRVNREQNKSQGTGAIWVNLTTDQVKRFEIPIPPLSTQERFMDRMKEIATQGDMQSFSLQKTDGLFFSLQQRAFQGEL